jgi:hypothetical protein
MRPLSIYSEQTRNEGIAAEIKWELGENIRVYGYHSPYHQIRLSIIQLNNNTVERENHPDFSTEVPKTRGLGTDTDGQELVITTNPRQHRMTIRNGDIAYNTVMSTGGEDMQLRQQYLPMEEIKLREHITSTKLQAYFQLAPTGPLKLKIDNNGARFITNATDEKATLHITNCPTFCPSHEESVYEYNLFSISEVIKKFPSKGEIEVIIDENLIGFQHTFSNNIGSIRHYERSK